MSWKEIDLEGGGSPPLSPGAALAALRTFTEKDRERLRTLRAAAADGKAGARPLPETAAAEITATAGASPDSLDLLRAAAG